MQSMTGFAQGRYNFREFSLFVSFKSYNNRYLETSLRGSGLTAAHERFVRDLMKKALQRGKVEVVLDVFPQGTGQWDIRLNAPLLAEVMKRLAPLQAMYGAGAALDSLLKLPMLFRLEHDPERMGAREQAAVRKAIAAVFAAFLASRRREGRATQRDLLAALAVIERRTRELAVLARRCEKDAVADYRRRVGRFLKGVAIDQKRLLQEAAISADKAAIAEEVHRLQTHAQRLKSLLRDKGDAARGKEADFLTQEMQRETHTIAAKTASLDIHQLILLIRREIEKIRQQVQNVE
jgi:uncharacterized protein (TIGR00255 family)